MLCPYAAMMKHPIGKYYGKIIIIIVSNNEINMEATIKIALTPEGNLELPPEIRDKFSNGETYSVVTTEDTVVFKKVQKFDWDDLRKRREQLGDDPDQLTTEEICAIVKEVRRERAKK
jgi:hypothetical protein